MTPELADRLIARFGISMLQLIEEAELKEELLSRHSGENVTIAAGETNRLSKPPVRELRGRMILGLPARR